MFTGLPAGNDMQRQNDLRVGVSSIHGWWPPLACIQPSFEHGKKVGYTPTIVQKFKCHQETLNIRNEQKISPPTFGKFDEFSSKFLGRFFELSIALNFHFTREAISSRSHGDLFELVKLKNPIPVS